MAAFANSERSKLKNTETNSQTGTTKMRWNKETEAEGGRKTWIWREEQEVRRGGGSAKRGEREREGTY